MGRGWLVAFALTAVGCRSGFDLLPATGDGGPSGDSADGDSSDNDAENLDAQVDGQTMSGTLVASLTALTNTSPPTARRSCGAAVAADDRIWFYGGFIGGVGASNTIAAYTPSTGAWATVTPVSGSPPLLERHGLAWDGANNVLVLFGGYSDALQPRNELYFYTPSANTFTQIPTTGTWPTARKDLSMVWVPTLSAFLVFGGNDGSAATNRFDELWKLSINVAGPSATWTLLTPAGDTPPKVSAPCVAYDPAAHRMILFGGQTADNAAVDQTYQYLVDTNAWQHDTHTGTIPSSRAFSGCAWDPVIGRLLLYGGQASSGSPINGVFAYDPDAKVWSALAPAMGQSTPGNCSAPGAAYSTALGGMFVFGGRTAATTYSNAVQLLDGIYE